MDKTLRTVTATVCLFLLACSCASSSLPSENVVPPTVTPELEEPETVEEVIVPAESGFSKICQPWMGVQNRPDSTVLENIARHDLYWDGPWSFDLTWETTEDQPYQGLSSTLVDTDFDPALTKARKLKKELFVK